jgi:hypothetical protein
VSPIRLPLAVALAAALALVGAACTGDDAEDEDAAPPSTGPTTSTSVVDLSNVSLAPVPGETTTTVAERGRLRVTGVVRGPAGPLPGATVRFERFVGEEVRRIDVVADGSGTYRLRRVPGGRYRIRAFLPPTHVQLDPIIRFLEEGTPHVLDLDLRSLGQVEVRTDVAPPTPVVGQPVNVAVLVGVTAVDGDGVVRTDPAPGIRVELANVVRWQPPSGPGDIVEVTDGSGSIVFRLECVEPGDPELFVRIPVQQGAGPGSIVDEAIGLDTPSCVSPPPTVTSPPTTQDPVTTSTTERPTTSTTRRPTTTTTTTERPAP